MSYSVLLNQLAEPGASESIATGGAGGILVHVFAAGEDASASVQVQQSNGDGHWSPVASDETVTGTGKFFLVPRAPFTRVEVLSVSEGGTVSATAATVDVPVAQATAVATEVATYIPLVQKGLAEGVAELDENVIVPLDQLPTEYETLTMTTKLVSPRVESGAGDALAITSTAPAEAAASQAGENVAITASAAVAGTETEGAANGGGVGITAGNAARLTSGNGNGGSIELTPGTKVGEGLDGKVVLYKIVNLPNIPTYTDNADAITHGLVEGDLYKVNDGSGNFALMVVVPGS